MDRRLLIQWASMMLLGCMQKDLALLTAQGEKENTLERMPVLTLVETGPFGRGGVPPGVFVPSRLSIDKSLLYLRAFQMHTSPPTFRVYLFASYEAAHRPINYFSDCYINKNVLAMALDLPQVAPGTQRWVAMDICVGNWERVFEFEPVPEAIGLLYNGMGDPSGFPWQGVWVST